MRWDSRFQDLKINYKKMFSLLPEKEKKKILQEYAMRRYIVVLLFLFATGIISVLVSFPAYLLSLSKEKDIEAQITALRGSSIASESESLSKRLIDTNQKVIALKPAENSVPIGDVLQKVMNQKTDAIKLRSFSYKKSTEKGASTLSFTGVASDRETLSQFVNSLGHESMFLKVNLPVSSLTKNKNPDFSIQVSGTF